MAVTVTVIELFACINSASWLAHAHQSLHVSTSYRDSDALNARKVSSELKLTVLGYRQLGEQDRCGHILHC